MPDDTVKLDRVIRQSPSGNSTAEQGQTVTLDVSSGPAQGVVPDVVGKTEEERALGAGGPGFRVTVVPKEDASAEPGTVLAQNPAKGATAARGSTVTLTVAEEPTEVDVPDVVGATQNKATETLSGDGLKVVVEEAPADSPDGDGVVQAQSPEPGAKVDRGSTVTITVGVFDPDLNPDPTTTTPHDHDHAATAVRIAVLAGGRSSEHEISLAGAASVAAGLRAVGHEVVEVTLTREGTWLHDGAELALLAGRGLLDAEVVFPVLHGPFGEDGTVQGLLELLDVPYVGSGVLASAVCLDKVVAKDLLAGAGIAQVAYAGVGAARWAADPDGVLRDLAALGLPVFVKPARLGSSVGIAKVAVGRGAGRRARRGVRPRPVRDRRGDEHGHRGRVLGARRDRRGARVGARRDRPAVRVVRLRREVRARRHAAAGARADLRDRPRPPARDGARGLRPLRLLGPRAGGLLRRGRDRAAQRAQHDARLHDDERLREALGGIAASRTTSSSRACASSRSSATHTSAPTASEAAAMRVTSKGQVTIPQKVREQLGITPGSEVDFRVDADGARLVRVDAG